LSYFGDTKSFLKKITSFSPHCNTLQHTATHCNTLQHIATQALELFWRHPVVSEEDCLVFTTLQHTATHCNTLQHVAPHCNTLQHRHLSYFGDTKSFLKKIASFSPHCNALQHTATHCNTLQHIATQALELFWRHQVVSEDDCLVLTTLQHTATHCNTLQHTATHCNTLQHRHLSYFGDTKSFLKKIASFSDEVELDVLTAHRIDEIVAHGVCVAVWCSVLQCVAVCCSGITWCAYRASY